MSVLISLLAFSLLITILVGFHEGAHFLMCRVFNIRTLTFSIGMGPRIYSRKWGDTDFQFCAIPIGGYVRPMSKDDNPTPEDEPRLIENQARWKQIAVYLAGPVSNFILAAALFCFLGLVGVQDFSTALTDPPENSVAARMGVRAGDRLTGINGYPVKGYQEANMALSTNVGKIISLRFDRRGGVFERELDLQQYSQAEAAKGFFITRLGLFPEFRDPVVGKLLPDMPAEKAGIRAGDRIYSVNGTVVKSAAEVVDQIRAAGTAEIGLVVGALDNPEERRTVRVTPVITAEGRHQIGISIAGVPEMVLVRYSAADSLRMSWRKIVQIVTSTVNASSEVVTGKAESKDVLAGPVGIANVAGQALRSGFTAFIEVLAMFSVALGFMNLLPIPVLDGGQALVLMVESVIGRSFSKQVRSWIQYAGLCVVVFLMFVAFYSDLARIGFG